MSMVHETVLAVSLVIVTYKEALNEDFLKGPSPKETEL